jgi:hypoxanthine phosphoribosyltransferase
MEKPEVLFSEEQIARRVAEVGAEITRCFAGQEVCVVGLMKSCLIFMSDIIREIPLDMTCHFLRASSFPAEGGGAVRTDIVYSTEIPYSGRHVLLLDDIIDTGITLSYLIDHIREQKPGDLKVCTLIDKPGDRKIDVDPDWACFTLREPTTRFIVGYGLDSGEHYRGLPFLGTISRREPSGGATSSTPPAQSS